MDITRKQVLGTEAEAERRGVQVPTTGRVPRDDRGPGAHQGSELLHRTTSTREDGEAETRLLPARRGRPGQRGVLTPRPHV